MFFYDGNGNKITIGDSAENVVSSTSKQVSDILKKTQYMAHGATSFNGIPANTMPRFEKAVNDGYKFLEVDVYMTYDNVPVGSHDDNITQKVNNNDGSVPTNEVIISKSTYEDLLTYDFGIKYGSDYAGIRIMKLEDLLYFCKKKNICVLMDLKGSMGNEQLDVIYDMVIKSGMKSSVVWYIGTYAKLDYLTNKDEELIYDVPNDSYALTYQNKSAMMIVDTSSYLTLTKDYIGTLHQSNIRIYAWTVNDASTADLLFEIGIDYICTDKLLNNSLHENSYIAVDDTLSEESENPVQNKVIAKQFQNIDEKIGIINLHKVTTVATLSSGKSSAFVYQLNKRISGLFKVPNLPPMYWYIYDETGTRINYYSFGACPTKIDLKDNDTTVTAIVYFVTGRVTKVMYSIADNTFATEVFEYSKYDIDQLINAKQNATDETLKTNDKTIVGAINEINGKIPTVQDILNALPTWQGGVY